jgi:hypothetical protein
MAVQDRTEFLICQSKCPETVLCQILSVTQQGIENQGATLPQSPKSIVIIFDRQYEAVITGEENVITSHSRTILLST